MALTEEQKRQCRMHLGVAQVSRSGVVLSGLPTLTTYSHLVETALNELLPSGETTVIALLAELDAARSSRSSHYARAGVVKVEDIELSDSSRGWREKGDVYASLVADLAACLGVDPPSRSGQVWSEP